MNPLLEVERLKSLNNLYEMLQEKKTLSLTNVKGGLQGFIALSVYNQAKDDGRDVLLITPTESEAQEKYKILSRYVENIVYLPPEQFHAYFSSAFSLAGLSERERALTEALSKGQLLAVCSMEALLKKLPMPEIFEQGKKTIKVGEEVGYDNLIKTLTDFGYERNYQTEAPGQFSVRGEIIDVFLSTEKNPVRIDFFDDEVDTIRYFDVVSQRSIKSLDEILITPLNENWLPEDEYKKALNKLKNLYKNNEIYQDRFDMVENGEALAPGVLFSFLNSGTSFIDYLEIGSDHKKPVIIWNNPEDCETEAQEYLNKVFSDYEALSVTGEAFKEETNRFFSIKQIENRIKECPLVKVFMFAAPSRDVNVLDMDSNTIESFAGQPKLLKKFLQNRLNHNYFIQFFAKNERGLEKLKNYISELGLNAEENGSGSGIHYSIGEITDGFELAQDRVVFLNESDFFKEAKKRRSKRDENTRKIDHFAQLQKGDFVVHDEYGIGKYLGMEQIDFDGNPKDMMHIEYANDDSLYIPVEQMDLIQVYIGTGSDEEPELNELGSKKWNQAKRKARKAAESMAEELISLYSKRENTPGYSFSEDTVWQRDFEEAFPFEETDDQLLSIEEVKKDMEADKAMDRLLCGDVGYGKTEVAFRAAFKAAMEGKQTAILVPTTVLSQQHYLSALERFKDFNVNIEVLSRFKKPKEQKEIIRRLKEGDIDIIIGTHRLLSQDIGFKDLGLLIVDEEQRFGVKSKERIKQIKENVDVLTLSATPIPRTLHMSLSGVRDMSVLEEPPRGRRPVQTYVLNYSEQVIKDAIQRELDRNGQIYYIHNRVEDIEDVYDRIKRMVPEARVVMAHGKMKPSELENVMTRFLNQEYDILLSTTIVENGLDVQNANTMIVEDGDRFGLSQLYQLRGRVGRSPKQAYAYITHNKKVLSEDAAKRLKAIRDFTAFGSGFRVALRDLEIRGAGNLLGREQSGHMVKIGYELYSRILQEAIDEKVTGEKKPDHVDTTIQLNNIQAYIPAGYIVGDEVKYNIYRKMARLRDWDDFHDLEEELIDRFGRVPKPVYNLMLTAMIKNSATDLDIAGIVYNNGNIRLSFNSGDAAVYATELERIAPIHKKDMRMNVGTTAKPVWVYPTEKNGYGLLEELYDFLEGLNTAKTKMQKRRKED